MRKSTNTNSSCEVTINYRRYISQFQTINETIARLTWNGQFDWMAIESLMFSPSLSSRIPESHRATASSVGAFYTHKWSFLSCFGGREEKAWPIARLYHTHKFGFSFLSPCRRHFRCIMGVGRTGSHKGSDDSTALEACALHTAARLEICGVYVFDIAFCLFDCLAACVIVWSLQYMSDVIGLMLPEGEALKYTFSGIHRHS